MTETVLIVGGSADGEGKVTINRLKNVTIIGINFPGKEAFVFKEIKDELCSSEVVLRDVGDIRHGDFTNPPATHFCKYCNNYIFNPGGDSVCNKRDRDYVYGGEKAINCADKNRDGLCKDWEAKG